MASSSILPSEDQFLCSICLDVFTDPISTACGHNYCKTCITQYWDSRPTDVYQCPLCQETFNSRPKFSVNKVLSEMADQFRKSKQLGQTSSANQEPAKRGDVSCDVCTETKLKALKSCLVCLTSYCETHLESHRTLTGLKRHKLINPVKNLENCICKKHDRPLELFCEMDRVCVCQFCTESDHKLHQIVSLEKAYEGKKAELGKTEAEVQQMIQERKAKIQEFQRSIELSKTDADQEIVASVEFFTALTSCIERTQAEFIDMIGKKQKATEKQAKGFIKVLRHEIARLKERSAELEQLSHTENHLHLLQNFTSINHPPPTKDWTNECVQQPYVGTLRTAVAPLEKIINKEMEKLQDVELKRVQRYAVDVTLDPDTAQCDLTLSEDGKQMSHGPGSWMWKRKLPDNRARFRSWPAVLGKQWFSSGRFYYEVQVKGKNGWMIGVARNEITERDLTWTKLTNPDLVTSNLGYWVLKLSIGNKYEAKATAPVLLPVRGELQKVGVFVDYEEGLVSFYDVENRIHLYSFTGCTFPGHFSRMICPFFFTECYNYDPKSDNSAPLIISPVIHTD